MIEQIGTAIRFDFFYTAAKVGKTGLVDVTVDVFDEAGGALVAGAAATEVGDGFYTYLLASGSVDAEGNYRGVAKTADTTVDQKHLPALWTVGVAGVERLDAAVSSRSSHTALAVWDVLTAAIVAAGSIGEFILTKLGMITTGTAMTIVNPVAADGSITIVQGDDYAAADSRQLEWGNLVCPDLTGATITFTAKGTRGDLLTTAGSATVVGVGSQTVQVELTDLQTAALDVTTGKTPYSFDVQATLAGASAHRITLVLGLMKVREDLTV